MKPNTSMTEEEHYARYGGCAFPENFDEEGRFSLYSGLTVRDYFAAQAIVGLISSHSTEDDGDMPEEHSTNQYLAESAYALADAMLAVRREAELQGEK